jgi:hypothetical protein
MIRCHVQCAGISDHARLRCPLGIEPIFFNFKSRGVGLEQPAACADRLGRLLLVMDVVLYFAVPPASGMPPSIRQSIKKS